MDFQINGNVVKGDITSAKNGVIVHGCNAQGAMGSGVALAIRNAFPAAYSGYRAAYEANSNRLVLGTVVFVPIGSQPVIANAITQEFYLRHPKAPAGLSVFVDYDAITSSFQRIVEYIDRNPHIDRVIHLPAIGAGLGGGDWKEIRQRIEAVVPEDIVLQLWVF